ncbi:MAG: methyltransferase family protein [Planctomycetota bacterium]|jgi:protein-S-isoprenylcysteine O-methyltransferase Ste14
MKTIYRMFAYFGLATVFGAMLYGFRHDPDAPPMNIAINVGLYLIFAAPHLVMTRGWFKRAVWGDPHGSPAERRVYIIVGVVVWVLVFALHRPIPGPSLVVPEWVRFVGLLGYILAIVAFFEGTTFAMIDGLLGVPGSAMSHSHGSETPLLTEGAYARVRHPMYRAALLAGLCSVVIHGHAAALLWAAMISATFVAFIPIEERQLSAARGEDYRKYREQTPYRIFRGVW